VKVLVFGRKRVVVVVVVVVVPLLLQNCARILRQNLLL
jgi:hypothetical protein